MPPKEDKSILQEILPLGEKPDGRKLGLFRGLDADGKPTQGVLILNQVQEGKPITSDLYSFEPVEGSPVMKATRVFRHPHKGPVRCASPQYRDNYDKTFGKKKSAKKPDPSTLN